MGQPGTGLAGILGVAAMVALASPADAAVFVMVQPEIPQSERKAEPLAVTEAPLLDVKSAGGAAITIGTPNPAAPARAGWVPLIGALALVAYRMRRPDGRTRFASAV